MIPSAIFELGFRKINANDMGIRPTVLDRRSGCTQSTTDIQDGSWILSMTIKQAIDQCSGCLGLRQG